MRRRIATLSSVAIALLLASSPLANACWRCGRPHVHHGVYSAGAMGAPSMAVQQSAATVQTAPVVYTYTPAFAPINLLSVPVAAVPGAPQSGIPLDEFNRLIDLLKRLDELRGGTGVGPTSTDMGAALTRIETKIASLETRMNAMQDELVGRHINSAGILQAIAEHVSKHLPASDAPWPPEAAPPPKSLPGKNMKGPTHIHKTPPKEEGEPSLSDLMREIKRIRETDIPGVKADLKALEGRVKSLEEKKS